MYARHTWGAALLSKVSLKEPEHAPGFVNVNRFFPSFLFWNPATTYYLRPMVSALRINLFGATDEKSSGELAPAIFAKLQIYDQVVNVIVSHNGQGSIVELDNKLLR